MRLLQHIRAAVSRLMLVMAVVALAAAFMAPVIALATANGQLIHAPPATTLIAIALFAGIAAVVAFAITSTGIQANEKSAWYGRLFSSIAMFIVAYTALSAGSIARAGRRPLQFLQTAFGSATSTTFTKKLIGAA